jgi:hypothetical protein
MIIPAYKPFDRFTFDDRTCFLSGNPTSPLHKLPVFPEWITDTYGLADKPFKLLDETIVVYSDIEVIYSQDIIKQLYTLEKKIKTAFTAGYEHVKGLEQIELFQWISKLVYGLIYHEIRTGLNNKALNGDGMDFSQSLVHKLSNLHLMLQSVIRNVVFEGVSPWTILIFPVNNPPSTFSYRDEVNTLTFSLKMHDFGIIACLQDNNANEHYHKDILAKVGDKQLHPIQFEELCGRFFYSAYLLNRLPQYTVLPLEDAIYIESMPLGGMNSKPLFDAWQNKTYAQVLENFWKDWGYTRLEINKDPEKPMSFISDHAGNFISAESIIL